MKKLEIIIRPEKLEDLKVALTECGITGMMVTTVMGFGNQMGHTQQYRGTTYAVNLVSKLRVETVVAKDSVDDIIDIINSKIRTGNVGDGKIFVYPVDDAIRVRTGERGSEAL